MIRARSYVAWVAGTVFVVAQGCASTPGQSPSSGRSALLNDSALIESHQASPVLGQIGRAPDGRFDPGSYSWVNSESTSERHRPQRSNSMDGPDQAPRRIKAVPGEASRLAQQSVNQFRLPRIDQGRLSSQLGQLRARHLNDMTPSFSGQPIRHLAASIRQAATNVRRPRHFFQRSAGQDWSFAPHRPQVQGQFHSVDMAERAAPLQNSSEGSRSGLSRNQNLRVQESNDSTRPQSLISAKQPQSDQEESAFQVGVRTQESQKSQELLMETQFRELLAKRRSKGKTIKEDSRIQIASEDFDGHRPQPSLLPRSNQFREKLNEVAAKRASAGYRPIPEEVQEIPPMFSDSKAIEELQWFSKFELPESD